MKTAAGLASSLLLGLLATSAPARPMHPLDDAQMGQIVAGTDFTIVNEITNQSTVSATTFDPALKNSWGLSEFPNGGPLWVADNNSGLATIYNFKTFANITPPGSGIAIPGLMGAAGAPTGNVFTTLSTDAFDLTPGNANTHAFFVFDTEDGLIAAWAPKVNAGAAITVVDQSNGDGSGAVFKGLAISHRGDADDARLFAADFRDNKVEMFDSNFHQTGSFTDPTVPTGFAPFDVQVLDHKLYVTFAKQQPGGHDDAAAPGNGFVDVFNLDGHLEKRLVSGGVLNSPWGLAIAPDSFGKFAGALLVGNFGDGKINAFDIHTGAFLGSLSSSSGQPLSIDGLWAMIPGSDGTEIFSSGPNSETNGLVGVIRPKLAPASWAFQSHVKMGR
jgi:uncharacterized protein (TIGR03118 family)